MDYKGPLFINPGGPGGSAVRTVKDRWKAIHVSVGSNHVGLIFRDIKHIFNGRNRISSVLTHVVVSTRSSRVTIKCCIDSP